MTQNDQIKINQIQKQLKYLLYKQKVKNTQYHKVYANGNGAMHYSFGDGNPAVVLINDKFRDFYCAKMVPKYKADARGYKSIRDGFEQIGDFFFDEPHLNHDNSLIFSKKGYDSGDNKFEFDENFQKRNYIGRNPQSNIVKKLDKLPNGMRVQFDFELPWGCAILDFNNQPIMQHLESVQKLKGNTVIIWQEAPYDDLYIVDFDAEPAHYADALGKVGTECVNQSIVDEYKNRYMNVVDLLLTKSNQNNRNIPK